LKSPNRSPGSPERAVSGYGLLTSASSSPSTTSTGYSSSPISSACDQVLKLDHLRRDIETDPSVPRSAPPLALALAST
jgi:hypothetical protein